MSKFWFFDRKGRPTSNEKRICDKFNSFIDDGSINRNQVEEYVEEYGKPMNESELDEMFGFLTGNDSNGIKYEYADEGTEDYDDEDYDEADGGDYEDTEIINETPKSKSESIDFNPFSEPVIERSYTKGFMPKSEDDDSDSDDDDDDETESFSDEDLKMPKDGESIVDSDDEDEDIPEPEWASGMGSSTDSDDDEDEDYDDEDEDGSDKLGGDNLQDLSPAQKRKAAEKTADALLNMYCQFVPMPFIKWSSFSEGKLQKMVFENKIDLSMQLENNVSVKDYIDGVNEQAQEVFRVTDETKEDIKDPLIDVLLEQDLALTPTQRLMLAVGGHLVTMGFSAFQLAQNNKQALETFEKFHIQMNQQKAPVYQETEKVKRKPRQRTENLSKVEKESVQELMKQMTEDYDDDNDDDDDDIIDAEHDPNVEVSVDYGDDD
jgi:hypothetical protein